MKPLRPAVPPKPTVHARAAFADLAPMFGTGAAFDVINREKHGPRFSATFASFAVMR
jgi:hypothetical protein